MSASEDVALVLRCREMSDIAIKARDILVSRMSAVGKSGHVYTFKHRIKSPGAILSKVKRKKAERPSNPGDTAAAYEPDHVTDAWGCRYVTLYQSHIPTTVADLLADFDKYNKTADEKIELVEFVVYTNRPEKDPLSIVQETLDVLKGSELFQGIKSSDLVKKPENRKSAYSSVHLVFSLRVSIDHAGKGQLLETARFEVQVRDIFEEGWGEIQHNLIYSDKDLPKIPSETDTSLDPLWQPHLNALKTFVDGCSQHASIIKKSYDLIHLRSMPSLETKSATSQTTDRDAIVSALRGTAPAEAIKLIEIGYAQILDAQEAGSRDEAKTNYLSAAEKFKKAIDMLGPLLETPVPERFARTVEYFLNIEYANCLYFSRILQEQIKSLEIYEYLSVKYPQDPTVRLRLATAFAATSRDDVQVLRRAIDLIQEAIPLIAGDPLTGSSHWLLLSCHVHLGFLYWTLSVADEGTLTTRGVLELLNKAIDSTQMGYDIWRELDPETKENDTYKLTAHKAISNLIYYAAKFVRYDSGDPVINRALIEKCIASLDELKVPKYREYYKTRDNIMHALSAIGKRDGARQLARDNVNELKKLAENLARRQLISTEIDKFLDEDELRNYRAAAGVIADTDD